jgi:hypothetical protein
MSIPTLNKFKVILNNKPTKKECANIGRTNIVRRALPLDQNGFVLTGYDDEAPDPEYPYLVVLDYDVGLSPIIDKLYEYIATHANTFEIRTGSNGIHLYFWCDQDIHNTQNKPLKQYAKNLGMKGFDVRGQGGIIFAPGCQFTDHLNPYIIKKNDPIRKISKNGLLYIINLFIWEPSDAYKRMRQGFRNIMNGDWELWADTNKQTGIDEWKYWAAFWREYLNCGGTLEEGIQHFEKTGLQRGFQEDETRRQLGSAFHQRLMDKRPSNDLYWTLFPEFEDKLKGDVLHTNVDGVITKLMDRVAELEKRVQEHTEQFQDVRYYFEGGKRSRRTK